MKMIIPSAIREKGIQVYRKEIKLSYYDFSKPGAHLVASINGRYESGCELYGTKRI